MKLLLVTFLCLLPFIFGQDYSCTINSDWGSYDLTSLYKTDGNAYAGKDDNGNIFYFNLCGTMEGLEEANLGCDPQSSVCIQSASSLFQVGGRPGADWVENSASNVSVTYNNGDLCATDYTNGYVEIQTTIILLCSDEAELTVLSVNYSDCSAVITASSSVACVQYDSHSRHVSGIFGIVLLSLCVCTACLCVCACYRRRRRCAAARKNCNKPVEMSSVSYQPVAQQPAPVPQQPIFQIAPQQEQQFVPMQSYPPQFQSMPSYYQPYYVYQPNAQQQQQQQMMPMVQLNEQFVERDNVVDNDEKLARELQAKFDNE